jgi:hypothetical protein
VGSADGLGDGFGLRVRRGEADGVGSAVGFAVGFGVTFGVGFGDGDGVVAVGRLVGLVRLPAPDVGVADTFGVRGALGPRLSASC